MQDTQRELQRFHSNVEYFHTHRDELLRQYPEQWVAIFDERVVGADSDYERLLKGLKADQIPLGKVYIQQATDRDELLILAQLFADTSFERDPRTDRSLTRASSFQRCGPERLRSRFSSTPVPTAQSSLRSTSCD
jgi:hypothetical protein